MGLCQCDGLPTGMPVTNVIHVMRILTDDTLYFYTYICWVINIWTHTQTHTRSSKPIMTFQCTIANIVLCSCRHILTRNVSYCHDTKPDIWFHSDFWRAFALANVQTRTKFHCNWSLIDFINQSVKTLRWLRQWNIFFLLINKSNFLPKIVVSNSTPKPIHLYWSIDKGARWMNYCTKRRK